MKACNAEPTTNEVLNIIFLSDQEICLGKCPGNDLFLLSGTLSFITRHNIFFFSKLLRKNDEGSFCTAVIYVECNMRTTSSIINESHAHLWAQHYPMSRGEQALWHAILLNTTTFRSISIHHIDSSWKKILIFRCTIVGSRTLSNCCVASGEFCFRIAIVLI